MMPFKLLVQEKYKNSLLIGQAAYLVYAVIVSFY